MMARNITDFFGNGTFYQHISAALALKQATKIPIHKDYYIIFYSARTRYLNTCFICFSPTVCSPRDAQSVRILRTSTAETFPPPANIKPTTSA